MGATNGLLTFTNVGGGVTTVSMYFAGSDAVGKFLSLSTTGIAPASGATQAVLPAQVNAMKLVAGPATGAIKLWWENHPVGFFDLADHQAGNTANNFIPLNLPAGAKIMVEVIGVCAA